MRLIIRCFPNQRFVLIIVYRKLSSFRHCLHATELGLQAAVVRAILMWPRIFSSPLLAVHISRHGHLSGSLGLSAALSLTTGHGAHKLPEPEDFIKNHLAHLANIIDNLEVEVEGSRAVGLIAGIVPDGEVGVLESILNADTAGRVEGEHAVEEIEGVGVGLGEELLEGLLGHGWQVANVFLGSGRADTGEGLLIRCAEDVQDLVQLIDVISALEEWAATEKLGKDAANGPYIN